jgi:hypothetical protein
MLGKSEKRASGLSRKGADFTHNFRDVILHWLNEEEGIIISILNTTWGWRIVAKKDELSKI